jgi:GNAT superfamily N-acetyltransferase
MDKAPVGGVTRGTIAGRFEASYVHADNAFEDGESLFDVMDAHSQETAEIYGALYDPATDEPREDVNELLGGDFLGGNLLVINRVEILPAYRGMGLGLATMLHLIRRHSAGCGIVAIKAYPLQFASGFLSSRGKSDWEIKMAYDSFRSGKEVAQEKLISRYKKLGFEAVGDEGVMVLSTAMKNPIPKEIHRWVPRSALRKPDKR